MKLNFTLVGKCRIELRRIEFPTIVTFKSGAHGKKERGHYCFWTAVLKHPVFANGPRRRVCRKITGRARVIFSPGERFERMKIEMRHGPIEDRPAYRKLWENYLQKGNNIAFIRPATKPELNRWMKSHSEDAKHVYEHRTPRYK